MKKKRESTEAQKEKTEYQNNYEVYDTRIRDTGGLPVKVQHREVIKVSLFYGRLSEQAAEPAFAKLFN